MINFKKFYKYGIFNFPITVSIDDIEGIVEVSAKDFSTKFLLDDKEFSVQYFACIEHLKRSIDSSPQLKKSKRDLIENHKFELIDNHENNTGFTLRKQVLYKSIILFTNIRYSYGQIIIGASTVGSSFDIRQEVFDFNNIYAAFDNVVAQFRDYVDSSIKQGTATLVSKLESIGFEKMEAEQ